MLGTKAMLRRHHDMGGLEAGPIDREEHAHAPWEKKVDALMALESQTFEGGALGSQEATDAAPPASQPEARRAWLKERWERRASDEATRFRDSLVRWYGPEAGAETRYAEAFEICEYGRQPSEEDLRKLFPFFEIER